MRIAATAAQASAARASTAAGKAKVYVRHLVQAPHCPSRRQRTAAAPATSSPSTLGEPPSKVTMMWGPPTGATVV
eukprot:10539988-Lingulodinium_polyedra.AAC.1